MQARCRHPIQRIYDDLRSHMSERYEKSTSGPPTAAYARQDHLWFTARCSDLVLRVKSHETDFYINFWKVEEEEEEEEEQHRKIKPNLLK